MVNAELIMKTHLKITDKWSKYPYTHTLAEAQSKDVLCKFSLKFTSKQSV